MPQGIQKKQIQNPKSKKDNFELKRFLKTFQKLLINEEKSKLTKGMYFIANIFVN